MCGWMKEDFKLFKMIRDFKDDMQKMVRGLPNKEKVLRDSIIRECDLLLRNGYFANELKLASPERFEAQCEMIASIKMLDNYLYDCFSVKYISDKDLTKYSNELMEISRVVKAWRNYRSRNGKSYI